MNYSSAITPTATGFYWWKPIADASPILCIVSHWNGKNLEARLIDPFDGRTTITREVAEMAGLWTGPVTPPTDTPAEAADTWLCNRCGTEFAERQAAAVAAGVHHDTETIACPNCWSNCIDDDAALTAPGDRIPAIETAATAAKSALAELKALFAEYYGSAVILPPALYLPRPCAN